MLLPVLAGQMGGLNMFAYALNNPVMYWDPTGEIAKLLGAGIAALTFAVVNTAVQLVSDTINFALTGQWNSGWEEYLGAFLGGLAGGATFFATGGRNLGLTFGAMSGTQTLITNLLTNATGRTNHSALDIFINTSLSFGIGFTTGKLLGGTRIQGITAGRNSFMAVWKSGLTKLRNSTVSRMSIRVMSKGFAAVGVLRAGAAGFGGLLQSVWFHIQNPGQFGPFGNLAWLA